MRTLKNGQPITSVCDWESLAGPKADYQWAKGGSAFELAEAWCGSGTPAMPDALRQLLDSREETRGVTVDVVLPEHRIPFDSHGGEPRDADLAFVGETPTGKVAVTIDAKADEPFGTTVAETLAAALERGIEAPESRGRPAGRRPGPGTLPHTNQRH